MLGSTFLDSCPNMSSPARTSALIAAFLVVVLATKLAAAQSSTPSCVTNIIPCADYLNSTKPPPSCCTPLLQAVTEQLDCLCNLYANPELLKTFGINITQALLLPKACGISSDISACKAVAPSSSSLPPPGVPGGNNGNGVDKIAFTGLSSLFILGASLMFL